MNKQFFFSPLYLCVNKLSDHNHPLADLDAVAPVQFHLCPVVAVAEDMLMTSKINCCVSYAMKTVVSQRKSQLMIIIYTWWASMPRPINPESYRSSHELTEMKS